MKKYLADFKDISLYFFAWLLLCFIDRFLFLISFIKQFQWNECSNYLATFWHGLLLDLSLASYLTAFPFLMMIGSSFFKPQKMYVKKIIKVYTFIALLLFVLITIANICLYQEWGDKISKRAVDLFFESPQGALASVGIIPFILLLVVVGLLVFVIYKGFFWILRKQKFQPHNSIINGLAKLLLGAIILFTFIRGGYGRATLNPSIAYFSQVSFYNHAAVNTHWAFLHDFFKTSNLKKSPYRYFDKEVDLTQIIKPAFDANPDSTRYILTEKKPNVVLIILESYVANLIEPLGGEKGIAPHMAELMHEGVSFSHIYAAGDRSDKGMIAVMSGFPAQGPESIIKYISKHEGLPSIGIPFKKAGYQTSFYHGGQSEFYNFKSYMITHGITRIVDNNDFGLEAPRSSWGVYDHAVFQRMLKDYGNSKQPFFSTMFTLINHEPYELNTTYKFGKNNEVNKFKSTAFYTDSVLFDFVSKAKKEPWYKNTLFVVVADHGHRLPAKKWELFHPNRYHIPMFMFGDVIKPAYRGKIYDRIGNQTDLATTLLTQLHLDTKPFHWSRDLLNPTTPQVAFYNSKDYFGIVTPRQTVSYDVVGKQIAFESNKNYPVAQTDSLLNIGKAFYQKVYQEFLTY